MKEKLTTFLLTALVLSSLLLIYQLWYGHDRYGQVDPADADVPKNVFFENPRPLDGVITPERILVELGDCSYLLRPGQEPFAVIWGEIALALRTLSSYEYRARESLVGERPTLQIWFDPLLPVGSGAPWLYKDRYREIRKLELWTSGEEAWVVLQETDGGEEMALRLPGQLASSPQRAIPEGLVEYKELVPGMLEFLPSEQPVLKDGLAVPCSPVEMPELYLKRESLDQERLADAFFVDRSLVRKIQEKRGASIYTDGAKGLRIKERVEFSDPVQEKSITALSYLSALGACSKYICSYGGWPPELRLQRLIIDHKGRYPLYRADLKYYWEGYPLVGSEKALSLVFSGSGLVEYSRLVYNYQSLGDRVYEIAPYQQALEKGIEIYYRLYGEADLLVLEALDLVYAETGLFYQPVAVPAWLIQVNGERIILQAVDLSLLEGVGS